MVLLQLPGWGARANISAWQNWTCPGLQIEMFAHLIVHLQCLTSALLIFKLTSPVCMFVS